MKYRFFFIIISLLCLNFFNLSCGLDNIEYYEEPIPLNIAYLSEDGIDNIALRTFSFSTNNVDNNSSAYFKGTGVFYKIYNSYEKADSEGTALKNLAANDISYSSANSMIKSYPYYYKPINDNSFLFGKETYNYEVSFDFTNPDGNYSIIRNNDLANPIIPKRQNGQTFDFTDKDNLPKEGDNDFDYVISISDEGYYVQFFAVSVGLSQTLTEQYSNIVYLGCIKL